MEFVTYLDMDGVFVNFLGGAALKLGRPWTDHKTAQDKLARDETTFGTEGFWESLPEFDWSQRLWALVKPLKPHILTAYPYRADDPKNPNGSTYRGNAFFGKMTWLKDHGMKEIVTGSTNRYHCHAAQDKKRYAYTVNNDVSHVLIDDSPAMIHQWTKAGGYGIHFKGEETIKNIEDWIAGGCLIARGVYG